MHGGAYLSDVSFGEVLARGYQALHQGRRDARSSLHNTMMPPQPHPTSDD